jgi:hypothetical protein
MGSSNSEYESNPLALSLSKGCPFLETARWARKNRTVLRQAQHERLWGSFG